METKQIVMSESLQLHAYACRRKKGKHLTAMGGGGDCRSRRRGGGFGGFIVEDGCHGDKQLSIFIPLPIPLSRPHSLPFRPFLSFFAFIFISLFRRPSVANYRIEGCYLLIRLLGNVLT